MDFSMLEALKQFTTRHPTFHNHSVYAAGERYAGFFVPALAARILDGQHAFPLNLAVGFPRHRRKHPNQNYYMTGRHGSWFELVTKHSLLRLLLVLFEFLLSVLKG